MRGNISKKRLISFAFDFPHQPQLQASSGPMPRIRIWPIACSSKRGKTSGNESHTIHCFPYIKIQLGCRRPGGHKQRKLNDHVYSFLLFVSSKPHYQAEF